MEIEKVSLPQKVSMGDEWFEIASRDHFWMRRRFQVFEKLGGHFITPHSLVGEVGCGHGIVQTQIEKRYSLMVDGFDLNLSALKKSVADLHRKFLYDIHERNTRFKNAYDILIVFDVIEHVVNPVAFLDAAGFHLKSGGVMIINVPALKFAFSKYDFAVGHLERYSLKNLKKIAAESGFEYLSGSYWGMFLLPFLFLRKISLLFSSDDPSAIIRKGMTPPSALAKKGLFFLSGIERIPQTILGSSAMCIFKKQ